MIGILNYWTVYTFHEDVGVFVLRGLWSEKKDADSQADQIKKEIGREAFVAYQSHERVIKAIIEDRLDQLYKPLMKLAGIEDSCP